MVDGDTIDVAGCPDAGRIRLLLVDAPEVTTHDCYSGESAAFVEQRLLGNAVELEADATDMDQYGRRLRYAWVGDELFDETLARDGYAKLLVFENVKYRDRIAAAEADARSNLRGLWAACGSGACLGDIRVTALDKKAEVVTLEGKGDLTGWEIVSARGAATQRFPFPPGFAINGSVEVVSGTKRFADTPIRLWWTTDSIWNNSDDDDALLYDAAGHLVCQFDDGQ